MFAVNCRNLNAFYGSNHAIQDMNMHIEKGAVFGLIGPNGSGKSTTMNMITTLLNPSSGILEVMGFDATKNADEIRQRIGLAPEEPAMFSGLTALEFVKLSGIIHGMTDDAAEESARIWLERFELTEKLDQMIASFSKGMKRKTLVCSALVHDPELIVMDEPLDGLDIFAQKTLKEALAAMAEKGKTVIYSTHILETVENFCSHVGLLQKGRVLSFGPLQEVKESLGISTLGEAFTRPGRS